MDAISVVVGKCSGIVACLMITAKFWFEVRRTPQTCILRSEGKVEYKDMSKRDIARNEFLLGVSPIIQNIRAIRMYVTCRIVNVQNTVTGELAGPNGSRYLSDWDIIENVTSIISITDRRFMRTDPNLSGTRFGREKT